MGSSDKILDFLLLNSRADVALEPLRMLTVCATGVNQAPSYGKDLMDDRDAGGSR
jgi:hypothetical protein